MWLDIVSTYPATTLVTTVGRSQFNGSKLAQTLTAIPEDAVVARRARSVAHLQELYTVVVAIALSLVVDRLIPKSGARVDSHRLLLGASLLITLIPFYMGALRHLDEQYAEAMSRSRREFSILVDFLLLFLESCAFLALAVSVARPRVFAFAFLLVLIFDVAWAWLATTFLLRAADLDAQRTWLRVNMLAAAVVGLVVIVVATHHVATTSLWWMIPVIAIARTAVDVSLTWRFYAGL
jgi:hypothetical protein